MFLLIKSEKGRMSIIVWSVCVLMSIASCYAAPSLPLFKGTQTSFSSSETTLHHRLSHNRDKSEKLWPFH